MTAIKLPVTGCRSRSRFGACNRERHAPGQVHFVDMGNSFGFGYRSASGHSTPVGYGRLSSDGTVFTPTSGGVKAGQRALACPGCLKRGVTLRPGPEGRFVCRFCDWTAESNGHTPIDVRRRRSLRTFNETHPDRPAG